MQPASELRKAFVPGMGLEWLLPLYDPFTKLVGLDRTRDALIDQAALQPLHHVLDVGCGTGTLALRIKALFPTVEVSGLDPDEHALARARRKTRRAGVPIAFERGFPDALPYPDASFDHVFSSFMFHHLARADKESTLREVRRVLKPGGYLQLLDFCGPESGNGLRLLRSYPRLGDNAERRVLALMIGAGLAEAETTGRRRLLHGVIRIAYYRAVRSMS
jgi:ubiquinone/menaquinone biosynthesis C-methylase UbiE